MIFLYRKLRYAALVGFVLFAASCGGGGGGGSTGSAASLGDGIGTADTGTVTVFATDAETDQFSEINLTMTRAELLGEGGPELLFEGEKTFDLLALANVTELLSVAEVPAGSYNKIRLTLAQIELVFHDGRPPEYPKLPGNGKLDINPQGLFYVDSDNPLTIQLDFDAEKSIKIVSTGSGKFNFRPVVLTKEVEHSYDTKLIRQTGVVRNLSDGGESFDLCLIDSGESDEEDCMRVVTGGDTSIFDSTGQAIGPGDLENGAMATVVGRLTMGDEVKAAAADTGYPFRQLDTGISVLEDPVCEEVEGELICEGNLVCEEIEGELICEEIGEPPLCEEIEGQLICGEKVCEEVEGQLICEGNLVCDDVEGELLCEEIEEPEEPLCEVIEGQLFCDDMECEEVEGELICEGNLVCDDFEGELFCEEIEEPEEPLCEEIEGQLICDDMECEEVDGKLICEGNLVCDDVEEELVCEEIEEEEEEECFNFKGDLICEEECFKFKGDLICEEDCEVVKGELICEDDEEEESEGGSDRVVLLADVIWLGDSFSRTENVACGPVNEDDVLGTWYQNAELDGEVPPVCDDGNSRPTILLPGARIYDDEGAPLGFEAIQGGVINIVDGILTDSGVLAVLVIVEPSEEEEEEEESGQLSGTIGVLEAESFSLITELGDRCVLFDDSETDVFETGLDVEGHIVFDEVTVESLAEGQRADAFGEQNTEGCLEADTLIIESE